MKKVGEFLLTRREAEVARLMLGGLANKSIARLLYVETCTVKFHINGILRKTKTSNRTEAACKLAGYGRQANPSPLVEPFGLTRASQAPFMSTVRLRG